MSHEAIAVLGAGSWGTALAIQFARAGRDTMLWGRNAEHLKELRDARENARYLPGAEFPERLAVQADLASAVATRRDILVSVPSHAFRECLRQVRPLLRDDARVAWATKGFELETGKLPHQVANEELGREMPKAVLSGPTFAKEVGVGLPTAMTVASADPTFARDLAGELSSERFRAYTSSDVIGVEVGGAVKNVLAIGAEA